VSVSCDSCVRASVRVCVHVCMRERARSVVLPCHKGVLMCKTTKRVLKTKLQVHGSYHRLCAGLCVILLLLPGAHGPLLRSRIDERHQDPTKVRRLLSSVTCCLRCGPRR
jgi:hypothetical protein